MKLEKLNGRRLHRIMESVNLVANLTKGGHRAMQKKLNALLLQRGGSVKLWFALAALEGFAGQLDKLVIEVEVQETSST